jgi:hypothetical protein
VRLAPIAVRARKGDQKKSVAGLDVSAFIEGLTIHPVPERQQLLSDGRAERHSHGVLSGEPRAGLPAVLESMVAVSCARMFHGAIRLIIPSLTISV